MENQMEDYMGNQMGNYMKNHTRSYEESQTYRDMREQTEWLDTYTSSSTLLHIIRSYPCHSIPFHPIPFHVLHATCMRECNARGRRDYKPQHPDWEMS